MEWKKKNFSALMDELIVPGEDILQQDDPKESPRLEYILETQRKKTLHLRTGDVGDRAFASGNHA